MVREGTGKSEKMQKGEGGCKCRRCGVFHAVRCSQVQVLVGR